MESGEILSENLKRVASENDLSVHKRQLFDNPLKREFVTLDQLEELFGYKKKWFTQRMAEGSLPYNQIGNRKILFYVPDVRQAILENKLAPNTRKVQYDRNKKNKIRSQIFSEGESAGGETLEDFRRQRRCKEMGELD